MTLKLGKDLIFKIILNGIQHALFPKIYQTGQGRMTGIFIESKYISSHKELLHKIESHLLLFYHIIYLKIGVITDENIVLLESSQSFSNTESLSFFGPNLYSIVFLGQIFMVHLIPQESKESVEQVIEAKPHAYNELN